MSQQLLDYWTLHIAAQGQLWITRLLQTALALVALVVAVRLSLGAARRALRRAGVHANARLLVDRLVQFLFLLLGATWLLSILGVRITAVVAALGVASLAVSLAMQDVLKNLVAGLYILIERPFTLGETIDFRTFSGVVETIQLRTTALRTPGGQRVVIPNAMLFAETLVNRSVYGRQLARLRIVLPLATPAPAAPKAEPVVRLPARRRKTDRPRAAPALAGERGRSVAAAAPATPTEPGAPAVASVTPVTPVPPLAPAAAAVPTGAAETPAKPTPAPAPLDPRQAVQDVLGAVREAVPENGEAPAVVVETITAEKLTLRAEVWAPEARSAAVQAAWAVRARLPRAEITVVE